MELKNLATLKIEITIEIKNKNGQLISYEKKEANSYVKCFIDFLYSCLSNSQVASVKDQDGIDRTIYYSTSAIGSNWLAQPGAGTTNIGIVVGTGTNAVTIADYKLQIQIAHGTGSGQLSYGAATFGAPSTIGTTRKFTMLRSFANSSGGDITIHEVGIYLRIQDSSNVDRYFCIDRTLSTKLISTGATATVTYTIGATV
jgi:hypothetical protein